MKCRLCKNVMLDTGMEQFGFVGWCRAVAGVHGLPRWMAKTGPVGDDDVPCECFEPLMDEENVPVVDSGKDISPSDVTR